MRHIPRDPHFDATLALFSEGYPYISRRCKELGTDAFKTRLMFKKVTCTMGEDAARMFYHPDRFTRRKAMPVSTLMLLQDFESVQMRDGQAHRQRKRMFMSLMTQESVHSLVDHMVKQWHIRLPVWEHMDQVNLHQQLRELLCRACCRWAGISVSDTEVAARAQEMGAMIDSAGSAGPRNWQAQLSRHRTEKWARDIIEQTRNGCKTVPEQCAVAVIARHRDIDGQLLSVRAAAVELLNILRPVVAVARFITFAALALHQHPQCRSRLSTGDERYTEFFVQEVRRFFPFFPCIGGRVRQPFDWKGHHFEEGEWVLLDLYGTNHDPRIWHKPEEFRPERFADWNGSPFNFVAQGAGTFHEGHRCPGERLTIELVKAAVHLLVNAMRYDVPEQDLTVNLTEMPALPKSGFILSTVRRVN